MDYGLMLPYMFPAPRESILEWIRRAEDGPYVSLATGERITYHSLDQTVLLSAAAARTERVRISFEITIMPMHPAALVAKRIAALDVLSGGRVRLGLGIGDREPDYQAAEVPMRRRYAALAERAAEMRRLWSGEPLGPGLDPVGPPPHQPGGPQLWASGWGPKGLARAATWADGYLGYTADGDLWELQGTVETVTDAWAGAGRPAPPMATSIFFALGNGAEATLRDVVGDYFGAGGQPTLAPLLDRVCSVNSPDALRRAIDNVEEAGFEQLTFIPVIDDHRQADLLEEVLAAR